MESAGKVMCGGHIGSSRQISIGKILLITRRNTPGSPYLETQLIRTGEADFTLELSDAIKGKLGEMWNIQYCFGWFIWEFEAKLLRTDSREITFEHSESIHCSSRRRFLRVGVHREAYIARLHFATAKELNPPQFVHGIICELAGPGLLIETSLDVSVEDRVLVVFQADDDMVVQDVGEIRHVTSSGSVFVMAIELIGLTEENVDTLVHLTNAVAMSQRASLSEKTGACGD